MEVILWNKKMALEKAVNILKEYKRITRYDDNRMMNVLKYAVSGISPIKMLNIINQQKGKKV